MTFPYYHDNLAKIGSKIAPNIKLGVKKSPKTFKIMTKWQNFAKSCHAIHLPDTVGTQRLNSPGRSSYIFCLFNAIKLVLKFQLIGATQDSL